MLVRAVFLLLTSTLSFGCAAMKSMPEAIVATMAGAPEVFRRNQILDAVSGKAVSFSEFMDHVASFDVIFVGERHDSIEHHLIQVQILQALLARTRLSAIGMEFFQQDQQELLDRYTLEGLTEDEFLEKVDWKRTWGYPYHYYRPLLLAAKQKAIPVLALNAPRELVRKVARQGLASLDEGQRALIPREIDLGNEAHRTYVRHAYEGHDHWDLKSFEFFYEAQCVWDETMADNIAAFMRERDRKVIVFAGNGHLAWKFGVPDRTQRRVAVSLVTIMPYPLRETVNLERGMADYIWLTGP